MLNRFIVILCLISVSAVAGNKNSIDSLENILQTKTNDTTRIKTLVATASLIFRKDSVKAVRYLNEAKILSEKNKLFLQTAKVYDAFAKYYINEGAFDEAEKHIVQINVLAEKHNDNYLRSEVKINKGTIAFYSGNYNDAAKLFEESASLLSGKQEHIKDFIYINAACGAAYSYQNKYAQALKFLRKAEHIGDSLKIDSNKGLIYNTLGVVYESLGKYDDCAANYFKAIKFYERTGNIDGQATTYNNIGLILTKQRKYDEALKYYKQAENLCNEHNLKPESANVYKNYGLHFQGRGDHKKAIEYFRRSEKIYNDLKSEVDLSKIYQALAWSTAELGDLKKAQEYAMMNYQSVLNFDSKDRLSESHEYLGYVYHKAGDYKKAEEHYLEGLKIAEEIGWSEEAADLLGSLVDVYKNMKNPTRALECLEKKVAIVDSILSKENNKISSELSAYHESEKKELEIGNLTKQKALDEKEILRQQAEVKRQNTQKTAFAGGFTLMIILAGVVYKGYNDKKKANQIILKQKSEVEEKKEQIEFQKDLLEDKNREIFDSITYARRLQQAILPPDKLIKSYLPESFVLYKPKDIVAGDFYWLESQGDYLMFAVGDCTGHGVPGALVSVVCSNALNRAVKEFALTDPGIILDKVKELVIETFAKGENQVKDGMDVSLAIMKGNKLWWAGAYNPLWIVRSNDLIELKADKQPIGVYDNANPFTTHEFDLSQGDCLYLFSDGFADQFGGEKGKKLKTSRMKEWLKEFSSQKASDQLKSLDDSFENWKGSSQQVDDVCVMGVRI